MLFVAFPEVIFSRNGSKTSSVGKLSARHVGTMETGLASLGFAGHASTSVMLKRKCLRPYMTVLRWQTPRSKDDEYFKL